MMKTYHPKFSPSEDLDQNLHLAQCGYPRMQRVSMGRLSWVFVGFSLGAPTCNKEAFKRYA